MLTGFCLKYCSNELSFKYKIYKLWQIKNTDTDIQEKWYPFSSEFQNGSSLYTGEYSTELTAFQTLFESDNSTFVWKFEFEAKSISLHNGVSTGVSSLIVLINQVPNNGSCTIFPLNGTVV